MTRLLLFGLVPSLVAVAAAGLAAYGSKWWAERVRMLAHELEQGRLDQTHGSKATARFDSRELEGLPAPVQRYFRAALTEGQPIIAAVTIEMAGTFNLSATVERWKPFSSWQRVVSRRPGFLWNARVSMLPGLAVRVVDSYIAGKGLLHAALLGRFTVAKAEGAGEIARGEFMRFCAEAAWYPTALLPSQGVHWEAVGEHSANACITDGLLTLKLLFRFNDAGLIDSVRAQARGAIVGSQIVMMPWECNLSGYAAREGMTVPISCEAAWVRPEGCRPYFRGTITSLTYEFAK
jgi:hypothetical protein